MPTHLLAWNPKRWTWKDLEERIEQIAVIGYTDVEWSTGNTKKLPIGSRVFLVRLGTEPKGIVGSGITTSEPSLASHWDRHRPRAQALYADVRLDFLASGPLITWAELQKRPFSSFRWGTQASGITIPEPVANELEKLWAKRTGSLAASHATIGSSTFPEGARRQITVSAYERNPIARKMCLDHHGSRCVVCNVDLGERFGPIAFGFIHVHHLIPLSRIKKAYRIDPVKDLVPICPTCHAVIHLEVPPLSISDARGLLKSPKRKTS